MADDETSVDEANGVAHEPERELTEEQREHAQHMAVLNETARRVHTVMANYTQFLARGRPEQALSMSESHAIINGCVSGLAAFCAMMDMKKLRDDAPEIVDQLIDLLSDQFRHVFLEQRERVLQAIQQVEAARSEAGGAAKPN
jgi:hypothetical protein